MKFLEVGWFEIEQYLKEKAQTLCTGSLKCHRAVLSKVLSQALNAARKHGDILHSPMLYVELPESKRLKSRL